MAEKIGEIKQKLEETKLSLLPAFVEQYKTDARAGVQKLVQTAGKRYQKLQDEIARTEALKKYEKEYDNYTYICGIDEVEEDRLPDLWLRGLSYCRRTVIFSTSTTPSNSQRQRERNFMMSLWRML